MNIIIVGCGKLGMTLAKQLCAENHSVTMIDENADRLHRVTDTLDAMGVIGNGINHNTLVEAGIQEADLLVAATGNDEKNLLCCVLGRKAGHCETIARIRNPIYNEESEYLRREFGISMIINPDFAAAAEIFSIFQFPFAQRVDSFAKGNVYIFHVKIKKNSPLVGKRVMNLRGDFKANVLVCTINRGEDVFIPNGQFIFREEDTLGIVAQRMEAVQFFKNIDMSNNRVKNVIVAGGGAIAFYVSQLLLRAGTKVTLIERNKERCEELSTQLPKATIICGDASDQELLQEEGISEVDGFAALTGIDEENILLSLYANEVSKAKTITGVGRTSFVSVINKMNLGSIIYPRDIIADMILRFVRTKNTDAESEVETLYKLAEGKAELLEFRVKADASYVGKIIMDLKFKKNTLICCIYRGGKIIIPSGSDKILKGDSVLIVQSGYRIDSLKDIFEG